MWQPADQHSRILRPKRTPAKLFNRIATAIHSQRHPTQCYADVYTHCNTRLRWQMCRSFTKCGVQGHRLGHSPLVRAGGGWTNCVPRMH
ncbi:hypothetical protein M3J09_001529 [Ascochyta lentis]